MEHGIRGIINRLRHYRQPPVPEPEIVTNPGWQEDYNLLRALDGNGYFPDGLTLREFVVIKEKIQSPGSTVYDIGGGSNPCRAFALQDPDKVVSIDPAYNYYDGDVRPTDDRIFGGKEMRVDLARNVSLVLENATIPENFGQKAQLNGSRRGRERVIDFIPEDASLWLQRQGEQTLDHLIMLRFFPNDETWSHALAALKNGGTLITTGIGLIPWPLPLGQDIVSTPIPLNSGTQAIGLEPLSTHPNILFYKKISHAPQQEVLKNLVENNNLFARQNPRVNISIFR